MCRSKWQRGLRRACAAARLVGLPVRISPGAWMSLVSVVCCQVGVSASGRALVQRSPTECGVSECDRETLTMRRPKAHYELLRHQNEGLCVVNIS